MRTSSVGGSRVAEHGLANDQPTERVTHQSRWTGK